MDDAAFQEIANKTLSRMREMLGHAESVHAEMPYTILVALIAECALLADDPASFMTEFFYSVNECRTYKVDQLIRESVIATHH